MKLKAVVDSLEGIDEAYQGLYTEKGGKYVLSIDGIDAHPTVSGLVSALDKERSERKSLKDEAGKWRELVDLRGGDADDLTPQELHAALEAGGAEGDVQSKIDAAVKAATDKLATRHTKELEKVAGEAEKYRSGLRGVSIESALDRKIAESGIEKKYHKAVKLTLLDKKPELVENEDGTFRGVFKKDPDGIPGEFSIDEYWDAWKETDEAGGFVPVGGGGSGSEGNRQGNAGGVPGRMDPNDPLAWGQNAEKIAKGEMTVS